VLLVGIVALDSLSEPEHDVVLVRADLARIDPSRRAPCFSSKSPTRRSRSTAYGMGACTRPQAWPRTGVINLVDEVLEVLSRAGAHAVAWTGWKVRERAAAQAEWERYLSSDRTWGLYRTDGEDRENPTGCGRFARSRGMESLSPPTV